MIIYERRMRKKRKPTKEELEAEEAFKKMQARWDKVPKFCSKPPQSVTPVRSLDLPQALPPRKGKLDAGSTTPVQRPVYSGEAIGLATLHKSITTPVYTVESAIDIAKMRRG